MQVLVNIFPDFKILDNIRLGKTKLTNIVKNVIAKSERADLASVLRSSAFSILTDESLDISSNKVMVILVHYYLPKSIRIEMSVWCLMEIYCSTTTNNAKITANSVQVDAGPSQVEVDDSNELVIEEEIEDESENFPVLRGGKAEDLFKLLRESFKNFQIPERNIIGFARDVANAIFGDKNSVAQRFRDEFRGIYLCKCICHSIHLRASYACMCLSGSCEDLARNI